MTKKNTPPSISETAFACPHCGAYTTQHWHHTHVSRIKDAEHPHIPDAKQKKDFLADATLEDEMKGKLVDYIDKMLDGLPFFEHHRGTIYAGDNVNNLYVSECFNCGKLAVWVHDGLVFPTTKEGAEPNEDLPADILKNYEEARSILSLSPRGAAALLRLCIQLLCKYLGEKGKDLDQDIANLVAKGLNPLVQQSLDVVRVIGNEAVHPGVINLDDNRDTATKLFGLINAIADQMITHPKTVKTMYEALPEEKRKAIEARNMKALSKQKPESSS